MKTSRKKQAEHRAQRQMQLPVLPELGRCVEEHPLFEEMWDMLLHGFSAETVHQLLEHRYQKDLLTNEIKALPSIRTIDRFRLERVPPQALLPRGLIHEKLKRIDVKVDLFNDLQTLYLVMQERLARHIATEEQFKIPMPGIDKASESALSVAEMLWRVGQDLGLYPRAATLEAWKEMLEAGATRGGNATAQAAVFIVDGERKTVEQLTDVELDLIEATLSANGGA